MSELCKDFFQPEFIDKIKRVREFEAQRNHQEDMYRKPLQKKRAEAVELLIKENVPGKTFLEIGCAEGLFCNVAVKSGAVSSLGVDIVKEKIIRAQTAYPDCQFIVASAENPLPLTLKYDVVLCAEVLQHMVDYPRCVQNIIATLAPQGIVIISVPNLSTCGETEFAKISAQMTPEELLREIGGASFGKQNALWKFNTVKLAGEICKWGDMKLLEFVKVGAEPLGHQSKEQAENIFTVMSFQKYF